MRTYTVMLLYPDWIQADDGHECYTHACRAKNAVDAVARAKENAVSDNESGVLTPDDFVVLAVMRGNVKFVEQFDCTREQYLPETRKEDQ